MFEKILLPLDGSELAEIALPYGAELARRLGSELTLFHVCTPAQQQSQRMRQMYLNGMADTIRRQIRKGRVKTRDVKVNAETVCGTPAEVICDYAYKNNIGLMILATSGASGVKPGLLGSVADKVSRIVSAPTMLIRAQDNRQGKSKKRLINRILLPLDGSSASLAALPPAEELATKLKVGINLFQMTQTPIPYDATGGWSGPNLAKLDAANEKWARAQLIGLAKDMRQKGIAVTHSVITGTDPANEIIEVGKKVNADLVVMSTHGRSGITRWVLGSVAQKILHHGDIPLLLVRQAAS